MFQVGSGTGLARSDLHGGVEFFGGWGRVVTSTRGPLYRSLGHRLNQTKIQLHHILYTDNMDHDNDGNVLFDSILLFSWISY